MVRKISPSTGIRSLDRPARRQSLYRLSYTALTKQVYLHYFSNSARCVMRYKVYVYIVKHNYRLGCKLICGNKMPTRYNRGFYCRSYFLLNMFRAPLCPKHVEQAIRSAIKTSVASSGHFISTHFLDSISNNALKSNFLKIRLAAAELFHAYRRMDIMKLVVTFRNFVKGRNKMVTNQNWLSFRCRSV